MRRNCCETLKFQPFPTVYVRTCGTSISIYECEGTSSGLFFPSQYRRAQLLGRRRSARRISVQMLSQARASRQAALLVFRRHWKAHFHRASGTHILLLGRYTIGQAVIHHFEVNTLCNLLLLREKFMYNYKRRASSSASTRRNHFSKAAFQVLL